MRISDVGRVCAFIMRADSHLRALGHIDDLTGTRSDGARVAMDRYLALENDHNIIASDMFGDAHIGAVAAITYCNRPALALIGNIACINFCALTGRPLKLCVADGKIPYRHAFSVER